MEIAINLLISAMTLLTMAQSTPNLSVEFKNTAVQIANQAIVYAQAQITQPSTTQNVVQTTQNTQPTPVVVVAQTIQPVVQPTQNNGILIGSTNPTKIMEIVLRDENNISYGDSINIVGGIGKKLFINADYRIDGKSTLETITMTSSDGQSRVMDKNERACGLSQMGGAKDNCSVSFLYRIENAGTYTVVFSGGDRTKQIVINVE